MVAMGTRALVSVPSYTQIIELSQVNNPPAFINSHVHNAYSARNLKVRAQAGSPRGPHLEHPRKPVTWLVPSSAQCPCILA